MIALVCKAEFLAMIKSTVHFVLSVGYIPTEQTLTIFLYQLQGAHVSDSDRLGLLTSMEEILAALGALILDD